MKFSYTNDFKWERLPEALLDAIRQKDVVLPLSPTQDLIKKHRKTIDDHFWSKYKSSAIEIVLELASMGIGSGNPSEYNNPVDYLKTCRTSKTLIKLYLKTIRKIGRGDKTMEELNSSFNINLDTANMPDEKPFNFQQDAIDKLTAYYNSDQKEPNVEKLGWKPALLVMPTGSGKTMTAMWFLLDKLVKNGYKVLWLTHRDLLLEQAADTATWLSKIAETQKFRNLKGRIISGLHCTAATASFTSDDIIFYSIQTLGRNLDKLDFMLKGVDKDKFIVVIDEAHHTPMYTYRKTLELLKEKLPGFKLLGLTATPYRLVYTQLTVLNNIYNSNYFSCITMSELINKKFLATPHPETVHTDIDFSEALTDEEIQRLYNNRELTDEVIQKVVESKKRNKAILDQYLQNKEKYKKTIIFAVNQIHAETLSKELQEKGIRSDYVISDSSMHNKSIIDKFKKNELDVLVNVQILTEGSDIPDVKTVFLTRPTQSESLLLQMIGRALRGPMMNGTDIAYIVDFNDKWPTFQKWLNPKFLLEQEERENIQPTPPKPGKIASIPWDVINEAYSKLNNPNFDVNSLSSLPHGWYSLDHEDEFGEVRSLLVYDNARTSFDIIEKDYNWIIENNANVKMVFDKYFTDTWDPVPSDRELLALINFILKEHKFPTYYKFEERDQVADARIYAEKLVNDNIPPREQKLKIQEVYQNYPIIEQIYGEFNEFFNFVMKYYNVLVNPPEVQVDKPAKTEPLSVKPTKRLTPGPKYDLNMLFSKVVSEMFNGKLNKPASIAWSTRTFKGIWGYFRSSDRKLIINCRLDSPDIPQNVVEFVLYHELLHSDGIMNHNKAFKELEHKFPNWQECEHFLATIYEKFLIE